MAPRPLRLVPGFLAVSLLVLATLGNATRPAGRVPVPAALTYPDCSKLLQAGAGESTLVMGALDAFLQPIAPGANIAACSLWIEPPYYSSGSLALLPWDPIALAPDPTSAALRTLTFTVSSLLYGRTRADYSPSVVLRSVAGVAEPPQPEAALEYTVQYSFGNTQEVHWSPHAAAGVPEAFHRTGAAGPMVPLPGAGGVFAHAVCGGDERLQELFVAQAVVRNDLALDPVHESIVQRFRVPVPTQLYWIEVALSPPVTGQGWTYGTISVLDAQDQAVPPATPGAPFAQADFYGASDTRPTWTSHFDFHQVALLVPGHDYWLWVTTRNFYRTCTRTLTGDEGSAFTAGIGPAFGRTSAAAPFLPLGPHVLDFKVIGIPTSVIAVTPPAVAAPVLRLRIAPNPALGSALVRWSGAQGAVRLDVLDARGRRVAGGAGTASAGGEWFWRGARADGKPLPAGVYFVRATDDGGHAAIGRVVLVR